jgi:hypothetical protein
VVSGEAENKNSFSVDDDEKPPEPQYRSPWEELRAELAKANGGAEMGFQDECWLKEEMELRRVAPEGLLELVRKNPLRGFHSPMAGLKWLVKKFRAKTRLATERDAMAAGTASQCAPPLENPRCEKCGNSGRILERIEGQRPRMTDQYCDCRMGRDLEGVERRKRAAAGPVDGEEAQPQPPAGSRRRNTPEARVAS